MVKGLYIFRLQSAQYLCQTLWGHTSGDSSITLSCNEWLCLGIIRIVEVVCRFALLHSQQALPEDVLRGTNLGSISCLHTGKRSHQPATAVLQSLKPRPVRFLAFLGSQNCNLEAALDREGHGIGPVRWDAGVAFADGHLNHCSRPYTHFLLLHELRSPQLAYPN